MQTDVISGVDSTRTMPWDGDRDLYVALGKAWIKYCDFRISDARFSYSIHSFVSEYGKTLPVLQNEKLEYLSAIAKYYLHELSGAPISVCIAWIEDQSASMKDRPELNDVIELFIKLVKEEISEDWTLYLSSPPSIALWERAKRIVNAIKS